MRLAIITAILALATYRASVMLAKDSGPGECLKNFRIRLEAAAVWSSPLRVLFKLVTCTRCNSVWLGVLFGALWINEARLPWHYAIYAGLAFSAATSWIENRNP